MSTTATLTVGKVENRRKKNGDEFVHVHVKELDKPLFVGPQNLQNVARLFKPGQRVAVTYRDGQYGPIALGFGTGAGDSQGQPQVREIMGVSESFVIAWAKDIYIARDGITPEGAAREIKRIIAALRKDDDEDMNTETEEDI